MSDTKNIIIYPHLKFSLNDGGMVVQYYLAQVLDSLGINVKIYNVHDNNAKNIIFNKFVNDINTIDFNNTIVIYCEGTLYNPLRAKYVVRWMLSKLGENVSHLNYKSWNENELVYFFNNEIEMVNNNVPRKILSLLYIHPTIKAHNFKRNGVCYTIRKGTKQNQINQSRFKELSRFEITRQHNQDQYITIFNNFEYFVSYDALTFLNIIAALCGCISIIYPVEGVSKQEYFKMTALYDYMVDKNITEIYGLAYGDSDDEIHYSRSTLHLVKDQMKDIQNWLIENSVKKFIQDINHWDLNKNKINTYKNTMLVVDVFFYKNLYVDLQWMADEQLIYHYHNHGIKEGRIANKDEFNKMYPEFDLDFYKYYNTDITWMNEFQLMHHYHHHGRFEDRKICDKNFCPDLDIEYYKSFNDELKNMDKYQLLNHYIKEGSKTNKKYFEYDFIVNDDYSVPVQNSRITDLICNHEHYRRIDKYEKLVEHLNKYEKKYYIFNKESFYTYYEDFDFEYYKNRYFNNNTTITEKEILLYYHSKGKYEKHVTNDKINIIIYIPPFANNCGGIMVVHYFAYLINKKYNDKFCAKLFMHNNITYKNPFCNNFAKLRDINDSSIVIYPEIISGNPLNAKNVVRWILLELGIEMPLDHYKKWSSTDLIYHWEPTDKQLCCPFYNNVFTDKKLNKRDKTCYLIKKGRLIHKNINYIHPPDSICIDDLSLQQKATIFNECTFFYSYDPNTAYNLFSAACGCIPIIYEVKGISEEDYFKSKMFYFDDKIYNRGIVYGNNVEKINYILENKLNENNEEYYKNLFTMIEEKTFPSFLEELKNL